jgi:hypothetical protein
MANIPGTIREAECKVRHQANATAIFSHRILRSKNASFGIYAGL